MVPRKVLPLRVLHITALPHASLYVIYDPDSRVLATLDFQPGRKEHPASARAKESAQGEHVHLRKTEIDGGERPVIFVFQSNQQ